MTRLFCLIVCGLFFIAFGLGCVKEDLPEVTPDEMSHPGGGARTGKPWLASDAAKNTARKNR